MPPQVAIEIQPEAAAVAAQQELPSSTPSPSGSASGQSVASASAPAAPGLPGLPPKIPGLKPSWPKSHKPSLPNKKTLMRMLPKMKKRSSSKGRDGGSSVASSANSTPKKKALEEDGSVCTSTLVPGEEFDDAEDSEGTADWMSVCDSVADGASVKLTPRDHMMNTPAFHSPASVPVVHFKTCTSDHLGDLLHSARSGCSSDRGESCTERDDPSEGRCSAASKGEVGQVYQFSFTCDIKELGGEVTLSSGERVTFAASGLCYRYSKRSWLTEAQQTCAARFRSKPVLSTLPGEPSRGALSKTGSICEEHSASLRTCRLASLMQRDACVEASTRESVLLQSVGSLGDEVFAARWRSEGGEPHCWASDLAVWPLEAVIRDVRLHYDTEVWQRLQTMCQPLLGPAAAPPRKTQDQGGRSAADSSDPVARRAKAIEFSNVAVSKPAAPGSSELPQRVRIQDATLENVSLDFKDIPSFFGLTAGAGKVETLAARSRKVPVEEMDEDQLRAEVRMWRMRERRLG